MNLPIPDFSSIFSTIENFRYSITIGLLMLYFAPTLFPVGWTTVSATWQYASGLMFFLSLGMIISRDFWPWFRELVGLGMDKIRRKKISSQILRACKESDQENTPFIIKISDVGDIDNGDIRNFVDRYVSDEECKIDDDSLVVSESGLKTLKSHI